MSDPIPEPSDTSYKSAGGSAGCVECSLTNTGETFLAEEEDVEEQEACRSSSNISKNVDDYDSGCRTCCTAPHGKNAKLCCFFSTLAWTLCFVVLHNCRYLESNYLYCPPEGQSSSPCTLIRSDIGLTGYAASPNWLGLPDNFLTTEEATDYKPMFFGTCFRYQFSTAALSGFWYETEAIFGTPWKSAQSFAATACVLGFICKILAILSLCMAYSPKVWKILGVCFCGCGVCQCLTLVFFTSDVCELGCQVGEGSILTVVAGILWVITGFYAFGSSPWYDSSIPKATCCCCPQPVKSSNPQQRRSPPTGEYSALIKTCEQVKEILVVEKEQPDGSKVVEKTITYPDGRKSVERTIYQVAA